jgi:hypothetical protein
MPALPALAQAILLRCQFFDTHHSQEAVSENTRHPVALGLAKTLRTVRVACYFGNDFPLRRVFVNAAAFDIQHFCVRYASPIRKRFDFLNLLSWKVTKIFIRKQPAQFCGSNGWWARGEQQRYLPQ